VSSHLVKVVVTTYNRREWAACAIESVLAQTHSDIHIVIVDDASSDGTAELARAYAAKRPETITAITKVENRGIADSICLGLEASPDAPFVAFLNDDDHWHPSKLERQLSLFDRDPSLGLVFCEAEVSDAQLMRTGELFSDLFGRFASGDLEELLHRNCACASTILLTREVAAIAAGSMLRRSHVWDYYLMMLAAGYSKIAMVEEPLAVYRETDTGLHVQEVRMVRDMTLARQRLFVRHPDLAERVGGMRMARRKLALRELDMAIMHLRRRQWANYGWHSLRLTRQRSIRPTLWLPVHTLITLAHRGTPDMPHNSAIRGRRSPPASG
jgi:glycosyltransferase involved in cell wall biosynthesis